MKRGIALICLYLALLFVLVSLQVFAEVRPNGLISDNAVLQQGVRVPIWGTADPGEKVTVKFQNQQFTTTAHNGHWIVWLNPLKPGGPFTMQINNLEIKNILVGEVWLCSGQSNMAWQMSRVENADAEIKAASDPMLRLYLVPKLKDPAPLPQAWTECLPETVANFSAVAYYFGKHLRKALKVPIGLIDSSVGGTPAESWTSTRALLAVPELRDLVDREGGRPVGYLYRAMIQPLIPYAIKGAIWYQGESNATRAQEYRILLPTMIKCWRDAWAQGDFPFLIVQLAPYGKTAKPDTWPELREAQLITAQTIPNTGLAV
ncbi:MAG: sialate O-acetylesterase, partial [Armatimonadota bacterium]|nr:sialate O-acetylesterase [Armatimonadota bacterium]